MKRLRAIVSLILVVGLMATMVACGNKKEATSGSTTNEAKVIKVGTMGTYNPFSYTDESGKLTGFDLEVLREVEKRDSSLKFEFVAGSWDSLFPGLDADKFQMLANQITATPERKEKYLLTDNRYFTCVSQIIVKGGRTDIKSLEDLKGKTIGMTVGDSFTKFVEDWNAQHGNILKIKYYEQDIVVILEDIINGRIDATVNDPIMAQNKAKVQKLDIDVVGERYSADPTYFIFKKDETGKELKGKIDKVLKEMIDDGTLSKMSMDWFGVDYTK